MRTAEQHPGGDAEDRHARRRTTDPLLQQLLVAEPGDADRAPAGDPHRLQHRRQPPADAARSTSCGRTATPISSTTSISASRTRPTSATRSRGGRQRSIALRSTSAARRSSTSFASASRAASGSSSGSRRGGGPQTFADTDGYAVDLDGDIGLTNWHTREYAVRTQRVPVHVRRDAELAEGQAQR